ncbi:CoA-binding protein [Candidatus Lokiarchaeum ossiferum]|uniref:CoA-binding protein n=1 Tax=Candidatus Lokiarchaeum ossiferum TaxID=2951803 RepID=UPI00352FC9E0
MAVRSLEDRFKTFFNPQSIIIIGASRNEYTFNGVVVKNLLEAQYRGKINIYHPFTDELMGIKCLKTLDEINAISPQPDLAIILTQHNILTTVEFLGQNNIQKIMIETDTSVKKSPFEAEQLIINLENLAKKWDLQIMGPSMIGIIDFQNRFTSSVIPTRSHIIQPNLKNRPDKGVSFLAQSGGLTGACGWWSPRQKIPFAKIIHIGKSITISEADILDFLFEDEATLLIILYLKDIPSTFIDVLLKNKQKKPVLYKCVGKDQIHEEAFQQAGAIKVDNYIELFEFAKVFLWCPPPKNNSVGIIGPSSGAINLLISEMRNQNIHLAPLSNENRDAILDKVGGSTCALGNPVDFWPPKEFVGTQICQVYYNASNSLLQDQNVGTLFLALEFFTEIEFNFSIFENIKRRFPNKPIIAITIQAEKEGQNRIIEIGTDLQIPVFVDEVERGIKALKCLLKYYEKDDDS